MLGSMRLHQQLASCLRPGDNFTTFKQLYTYKEFFGCSLDFHGELYGGPGKVSARVFYPINQKETCIDYRGAFDDETPESTVFIFVTGFPKGVQDLTKSVKATLQTGGRDVLAHQGGGNKITRCFITLKVGLRCRAVLPRAMQWQQTRVMLILLR